MYCMYYRDVSVWIRYNGEENTVECEEMSNEQRALEIS